MNILIKHTIIILSLLTVFHFQACKEVDDMYIDNDNPITVTSVHLQDADDTVLDRPVTFARLGQLIRLEGSGFLGIREVIINGESAYLNPTLLTDNSLIVRVPRLAPTVDATAEVKNKIVLKKKSITLTHVFEIRDAAPSISRVSHTLPKAGEEITIYGRGLVGVKSITFPGNVVVTTGIVSDVDGEWCKVNVPAGVSDDGGSILVIGVNGGAYSPAYFNFKKGIVHNFDDVNNSSWSQGESSENLTAVIPTLGTGPKSQGIYRSLNKDAKLMPANDSPVDITRYWINNSAWTNILTEEVIPGNTPTAEVAVQMDIYFEGVWNSGNIRFVVADGSGASRFCMIYAPWESFGKRVPVENPGSWFTITLPFNLSIDYEDTDFQYVMSTVTAAAYPQSGPWLENGNINDAPSEPTTLNVYFDNIRIVPLKTPTYSDFGDEPED